MTANVDLLTLAQESAHSGPAWSDQSADLNVNLIVLMAGDEIAEHVNAALDVLLLGIEGEGAITIDGQDAPLKAGHAVLIPKGARRSIRCPVARLSYVTCHRRRPALMPGPVVQGAALAEEQ